MATVVHFRHPQNGYQACGMGDRYTVQMTDDINAVTCRRCLGTVTGKKRSNRQIADLPKTQVSWRIDTDLLNRVRAIAKNQGATQTEVVESAIKKYLKQASKSAR